MPRKAKNIRTIGRFFCVWKGMDLIGRVHPIVALKLHTHMDEILQNTIEILRWIRDHQRDEDGEKTVAKLFLSIKYSYEWMLERSNFLEDDDLLDQISGMEATYPRWSRKNPYDVKEIGTTAFILTQMLSTLTSSVLENLERMVLAAHRNSQAIFRWCFRVCKEIKFMWEAAYLFMSAFQNQSKEQIHFNQKRINLAIERRRTQVFVHINRVLHKLERCTSLRKDEKELLLECRKLSPSINPS